MRLGELAEVVGGCLNGDPTALVTGYATDSRDVKPGFVFLAIQGENVDGHDYAAKAVANGAVATLGERSVEGPSILVDNLVQALARLAAFYRGRFVGPVVGITGSAGKTTTKEFVAAALSPLGPVLKTQGNRNTEYTSPLVWTELDSSHRAVVIEMGMRGFGQIAHLAAFTRPTIGLVTNVGHSHIELVGSREGIAKAKSELLEVLPSDGWAVLWQDDDYLSDLQAKSPRSRTFGFKSGDCHVTTYQATSWSSAKVEGVCGGEPWQATLPAAGRHMALNACAAVLAASLAGVKPNDAGQALSSVVLPPMRMEVKELNGATVLLDCYNANPASMAAAIETLADLPVEGRRRAVVGEMRELGAASEEAHTAVGLDLAAKGIDDAVFYGEPMRRALTAAANPGYRFAETLADVAAFLRESRPGDAVLVKGSRALQLEDAFEEACHE